jgi:hypothetical protein
MRYTTGIYNRSPYDAIAAGITPPPVDGDLTISGTISRTLAQKSWTARVIYSKTSTAGVDSLTFKNVKVVITRDDHNGVTRTIFVGYYDTENMDVIPARRSETMAGYDYAQKLVGRIIPTNLLTLLRPDDQYSGYYQRLDFDNTVNNFTSGRVVLGQTSLASGKIIQTQNNWIYDSFGNPLYLVPSGAIALTDVQGTFQDDETIKEIGGIGEALANGGATIQIDILATVMEPEDWITEILGGALYWERETGVMPYRINPSNPISSGGWTPAPYDQWTWQGSQTRQSAIDEISAYHNFIFYVKWIGITPCAYWVHQDDIDNPDDYALTEHRGLGLPDAVTIYPTDPNLADDVRVNIQGDTGKNRVIIRGQDPVTGIWYENTQVPDITGNETTATESSGVYYGTEIPVEYYNDDALHPTGTASVCQAIVQDYAALIYAYQKNGATTWTAKFRKRFDLVLLQKMIFSGFPDNEIPDDTYRIVGITYDFGPASDFVTVTLIRDSQFGAQLAINRVFVNQTLEIQRVVKAELAKVAKDEAGTVISVDGTAITVMTEAGQIKITRSLT